MAKRQSPTPRRHRAWANAADWADVRFGARGLMKAGVRRVFPDHWSFLLGEMAFYAFIILVVTGVYLSLYFHPSGATVQYQGSYLPLRGLPVSDAFDSTMHLSFEVRGGLLMRQVHHWTALVFVAVLFLHLMRVFFTGAFRKPRELLWVVGFLLLVLAMLGGLTGYDLPGDLLSGTGLVIMNGTLVAIPFVGGYLSRALFGGEFPGKDIVGHLNLIHVLIIPAAIAILFIAYAALSLRHKPAQYPGPGRTDQNVVGLPFRVHAVKSAGLFLMMSGLLFVAGAVAQINPVWSYGPYQPDQASAGSQPDWYMGFADGLLRVMPGWDVDLWGYTLALGVLIPLAAGGALLLSLAAYPFIEAWLTPDDRSHHILDRPRDRPVRTALGAAWISVYLVTLVGAANDVIATHFRLSVNDITRAVRLGLFVAPVVVFFVAKRVALGLQRRDRDLVLHGRETGVIKARLDGEFVEVHEPLSRERLHTLTAREQYEPFTSRPDDASESRGPRGLNLRGRLSRGLYGPGAQIPTPTAADYREATGADSTHSTADTVRSAALRLTAPDD